MAAGTSENATPSKNIGSNGVMVVRANIRCEIMSNAEPRYMSVALFPLLSAIQPKSGVNSMVPNMSIEEIWPAISRSMPNLFISRSGAYFTNGKTAE